MPADTVGDLGYAEELGNYAEYSGAPNTQVRIEPPHLIQHCMLSACPEQHLGHCGVSTARPNMLGRPRESHALWNRGRLQLVGELVMQETYAYAKTLLDVATANPDGRTRALLVGGGIANFTDVAATFKGIIQVGTLQSQCACCRCNRSIEQRGLAASQHCACDESWRHACCAVLGPMQLHMCRQ